MNPEDIIVVNHWQTLPCNASTLPLVTLCNSIDFHESIAISYRASSHKIKGIEPKKQFSIKKKREILEEGFQNGIEWVAPLTGSILQPIIAGRGN